MRTTTERGFTLLELLLVVSLMGLLMSIAMPVVLRAKQAANEASAISSMRMISSAQYMYGASCGYGFFAPSLSILGTAPAGGTAFISEDLGYADSVVKSGYTITVGTTTGPIPSSPGSCNGVPLGSGLGGYFSTATPALGSGSRAFGINTMGAIFFARQQVPISMTDTDAPVGAEVISE